MNLTAVILTKNESIHLERCLASIQGIANKIVIVDCFSTDNTLDIARSFDAIILQRLWTNHADQFNWALGQLGEDTEWVLRIDADEYVTSDLTKEIKSRLPCLGLDIKGIFLRRRMAFLRKLIHHGGIFPVKILRLFRYGYGKCENRLMDEHIEVAGLTTSFSAELIDDNLNSLTWWTEKHNRYSSLEAVELLNLEYKFSKVNSIAKIENGSQTTVKRWLKENIYAKLPFGIRAFVYFFYRYFIRLGFLDGWEGTAFHFLQGFWYRYLVDVKILEVKRYMEIHEVDVKAAIQAVLGLEV